MTDIQVEHAPLGSASVLYRDLGNRVRTAYDPAHLTEDQALVILLVHLPRLAGTRLRLVHEAKAPAA